MKLAKVLGMVVVSLAMAACGSHEQSSVNGMSAGDYYNQFVSEKSMSTCDGQAHTVNSAEGDIGGQNTTLKLLNDRSFQLLQGWNLREVWSGSWTIDKTELVLNGVARATGTILNKQTALNLSFPDSSDVPVSLRGQSGYLTRATETYQCSRN